MAEHESVFAAAVAAVRPLLLGGTIRDAERVVLAVLRAVQAADATGAGLSGTETGAGRVEAREDANCSSILPQGLSEPEPCKSCGETYCDDSREAGP